MSEESIVAPDEFLALARKIYEPRRDLSASGEFAQKVLEEIEKNSFTGETLSDMHLNMPNAPTLYIDEELIEEIKADPKAFTEGLEEELRQYNDERELNEAARRLGYELNDRKRTVALST